jgi:hypothetical protein
MQTWDVFKTWLKGRIESATHSEWTAISRLNELQQLPNQTVSSFMTVFNDLRAEAAPELHGQERFWMKQFFAKLRSELRAKILDWHTMPTTLVDLEAQASRLEFSLGLHKQKAQIPTDRQTTLGGTNASNPSNPKNGNTLPNHKRKFDGISGSPQAKRAKEKDIERVERQRAEGRCFKCNEKGHMFHECPKRSDKGGDLKSRITAPSGMSIPRPP